MKLSVYKSYDDLPLFLNARMVAQVLGVSISTAYELLNDPGFPTLRVGSRMVVPKEKFIQWAVNSRERCYACKRALMRRLREALAAAGGCRILCDGSNADDLTAFRPGQRAVREAGVLSPLALAGLHKQELRDLGAAWGLDDPQQAARPCLLTRLAYGMHPEPVLLARLAAAEADLAALPGLGDFRLRLTPEPVLQAAVLPDGLRPQVRQVLDAHGFGGAGMVEGAVSGFFDR